MNPIRNQCRTLAAGLLAAVTILGSLAQTLAQVPCETCPPNAQASGVAPGIFATRTNGAPILPDPSTPIGSCEPLVVKTDLGYKALSQGFVGAGYYGGT